MPILNHTKMKIKNLQAREVLDSRGNPTVAVKATLESGVTAEAMVPSGASTGSHEAVELRDQDKKRYGGKGVLKACQNVTEKILPAVRGMAALNLRALDAKMIELDGTAQKSNLGANAILGVSLAVAQAAAKAKQVALYNILRRIYKVVEVGENTPYRLPLPMMNILNGGQHANNGLDIQEFMIVPQQVAWHERVRCGAEIFQALKRKLADSGQATAVGDEGGFAPRLAKNEDALVALKEAIGAAGYNLGKDVKIALDVAASEFYKNGQYFFDGQRQSAGALMEIYESWVEKYAIVSLEDGLAEDDWSNWQALTARLGEKIAIVGDDLFVTNQARLQQGIDQGVGNAVLIKVNQIGTLSETIDTINLARQHGYKIAVSHRSGETEDTTIADLAVAVNADYIKTGSLCRSERTAKYNRLLAIEQDLL